MMRKISSLEILKDYLYSKGIDIDLFTKLKGLIVNSDDLRELPEDIILRIISEAYGLDKSSVDEFSTYLEKLANRYLLWLQKEYLKRYIDYGEKEDYERFKKLINEGFPPEEVWKARLEEVCESYRRTIEEADQTFLKSLLNELRKKNETRVKDYIIFLYSRLVGLNEYYYTSLSKLFNDNKMVIKRNLSQSGFDKLQDFCHDNKKITRMDAVEKFSNAYIKILKEDDGSSDNESLIYFNLDQSVLNNFADIDSFYDYVLSVIHQAYYKLQNHKTLAIRLQNIFYNGVNIKWQIYSFLIAYAETFNVYEEKRSYYSPLAICKDYLEHRYNIVLRDDEIKELGAYFKGSKDFRDLKLLSNNQITQSELDSFKNVVSGFSFSDAYILVTRDQKPNSKEIDFIKNNTEVLLIFFKNEIDDRKIPCPVCGSFKTSGNSFPEMGIRSWECKNPLCSERSKTNRGKRFSLRSNLMQNALFDLSNENQISREIIKKWRKDIVRDWTLEDLYLMLIKYFSFVGDKISTINCENEDIFKKFVIDNKRVYASISCTEPMGKVGSYEPLKAFISQSEFVRRFNYQTLDTKKDDIGIEDFNVLPGRPTFIFGDSKVVLKKFKNCSIHNMVTSPPYYNAREYSQWNSLYQYLNDMLQVIQLSKEKIIDGGVFFYNIGDTYGNPNIVIKSKMGEKRIALGAYTVLLFELAGFEVLDNIIWDKGEPQSNRHKNNGKFTPYYQRPANCYEHIFIFKKNGPIHLNKRLEQSKLNTNIQTFSPVIKIGIGGENRQGHTAPFPSRIPELSLSWFTNEGEIVLDPYSGSGTTAITAAISNRIGIGIEKSLEYYQLSLRKAREQKSWIQLTL